MPIVSVQVLRAVAALLVVFGHAQDFVVSAAGRHGSGFEANSLLPWGAGVDLFFVISGFVMVVSSQKLFGEPGAAREFMFRRIVRIAPLYWLCLCYVLFRSAAQGRALPDLDSIVASFLFVPWDATGAGIARPIYELGWTLNHEMFFYVVFAACLWASRLCAVALAGGIIAAIVVFDDIAGVANVQLRTWAQPIVLEFVFGMLVALIYQRNVRMAPGLGAAITAAAVCLLLADLMQSSQRPVNWMVPNEYARLSYWGLPCAVLLAGLVLSRGSDRGDRISGFAARAGDASYSLYLLHPFVIGIHTTVWFAAGLGTRTNPWLCVVLGMALSVAVALVSYRGFEQPVTTWLRERFGGARAERQPATA